MTPIRSALKTGRRRSGGYRLVPTSEGTHPLDRLLDDRATIETGDHLAVERAFRMVRPAV